MRLFIDGRIYSFQKKGGISRIFTEILPLMCHLDEKLRITLFAQSDKKYLPAHERTAYAPGSSVSQLLPGKAKRAWEKIQRHLYFRTLKDRSGVWYSSYYTLPGPWKGPVVILVADIIHELFPEMFTGVFNDRFREVKRHCIEQADMVLCISETTRQDTIKYYGLDPKKTAVAHLAQGTCFYPEKVTGNLSGTTKPFFLYIGTRVHYKNFEFFMKTYASWTGRNAVDVVLVGPALTDQERNMFKDLGVVDSIHMLLSGVNDDQLRQLYNQATAFIYPSIYEGFGIPLLEAMACGCPVISSDIPSSREVAGDVPLYFSLGNASALQSCFDMVQDQNKIAALKPKGFEHARQYAWKKTASETLNILKQSLMKWETRGR